MLRSSLLLTIVLAGAACGKPAPSLVTGPYGGTTHRFLVDRLALPQEKQQLASDYGSGAATHDQLGVVEGLFAQWQLQSQSVGAQLAAGSLVMRVELTTEDERLRDDATVGVRFIGGALAASDQLGATLRDGRLSTNRIRDLREPTFATITLPLFADADAVEWPLEALEMDLVSDGNGGFDGELHGAAELTLMHDDIVAAAYQPFLQMVTAHPDLRAPAIHTFDVDRDGMISRAELAGNWWIKTALSADLLLHDGRSDFVPEPPDAHRENDAISLAARFHLAPCHDDACLPPPVAPRCDDRVQNGDESAVDCGGSCAPCAAGLACGRDGDCLSGTCVGGFCGAPSCSDGRRDGFETDVDCGPGCSLCGAGKHCFDDSDCVSGACGGDGTCDARIHAGATQTSAGLQNSATVARSAAR
jgi:hypothetical protein